jgi:hypothetical protein
MSMKRLAIVIALSGVLAAPAIAQEGGRRQVVKAEVLTGYHETPAVSSTGVGEFVADIDDESETIAYTLSYAGLEGNVTVQAHIHFGQRSVAGGISAFLCGGGDKPPCPPTAGTVSGVIDAADVIGPTAQGIAPGEILELIRAIRNGTAYVNVHTNKHPGGEIRGQIADQNQRETREPFRP